MNRLKTSIIGLLLLICYSSTIGQDQPLYNQYFFNPYLYNPSFVGSSDIAEVNLTHRQQWTGLSEAPQVSAFNFQYVTKGRSSFGFSFQTESTVLLATNTGYLTYGYSLPINESHHLSIGISGGMLQNTFDRQALLDSGDPNVINDPAVINSLNENYHIAGQIGINYRFKGLTLGFAIPKLLSNKPNTSRKLDDITFDDFSHKIATASYRFSPSSTFDIEATALYRMIGANQDQIELVGLFYYKDLFWAGGGYRYEYGPIGHFGLKILKSVKLGYSYEVPGLVDNTISSGSHEINLKVLFGKTRAEKRAQKEKDKEKEKEADEIIEEPVTEEPKTIDEEPEVIKETEVTEEPTVDDEPAQVEKEIIEKPVEVIEEPVEVIEEPVEVTEDPAVEQPEITEVESPDALQPGHYVVVGAFSSEQNARKHLEEISKAGFAGGLFFNPKTQYHYVHAFVSDDLEESRRKRLEIRRNNVFEFSKAWILSIE